MSLTLIVFPVVASIMHALGFWMYSVQTKRGTSKPQFVSWFIWAFLATLNALTFMAITSPIVALQTFVGSAGCIWVFLFALLNHKFEWPNWKNQVIFVISLIAIVVWKFYNPLYANLVLLSAGFLSFWPTWANAWHKFDEEDLPWYFWGFAYVLTTFNTYMLGGLSLKLVMPVFMVLAHLTVPAICIHQRRQLDRWLYERQVADY